MKRHLGVLAVAVSTVVALAGCTGKSEPPVSGSQSAAPSGPQTIEISYDDLMNQKQVSRSVDLAVGDFLQVSLGSNASTGFQWDEKMLISDPKVVAQTGHEAIAPAADRPGAPGKDVWMLQAMAPGNSTVSATYGRPWPGGEKEVWVFSANVTVR